MKHHRLTPYAYLLVPLLLVGFAQLFPSAYTIYLGFTEWDIISAPQFIGLENYLEILTNSDLRTALLNTFFLGDRNFTGSCRFCAHHRQNPYFRQARTAYLQVHFLHSLDPSADHRRHHLAARPYH